MKECGLYSSKCKNTGHLDKDCTGSKIMHASIDPSYVLVKSSKGDAMLNLLVRRIMSISPKMALALKES
jgi:hypothetical protein